ncbi:MAG: OmpH family outer membrane protein [Bdellovibrionota bacterium]
MRTTLNKLKYIVALCVLCLSPLAFGETKIAVVDMQKAIQSTSAGKKAKADLEAEFEKRKKDLQKKEADLKKMQEDLEKKRSVLSEEVLQKRQGEFQEEMMKYRDLVGKNQMEIQKKERDLSGPIVDKVRKVIAKIAKEKGYSMVLENSAMVLYSEAGSDITDQVIAGYEKEK